MIGSLELEWVISHAIRYTKIFPPWYCIVWESIVFIKESKISLFCPFHITTSVFLGGNISLSTYFTIIDTMIVNDVNYCISIHDLLSNVSCDWALHTCEDYFHKSRPIWSWTITPRRSHNRSCPRNKTVIDLICAWILTMLVQFIWFWDSTSKMMTFKVRDICERQIAR